MADAFDRAWDTVKRWDDWQEEIVDLRSPAEQIALPADQMPTTETEPDLEPQIDMGGDICCINAKNRWVEFIRDHVESGDMSDDPESLTVWYESMDCEDIIPILRDLAGHEPGRLYAANVTDRKHSGGPNPEHWEARQILEAYDKCVQEGMFDTEGDNTVDMHLSDNDPFEAGWGHIAKKHPKEDLAWRTLESNESMPGPIGVAGTKGKRHYQKLGTDLFNQSGSSILAEPFAGGLGLTFGIRPPKAFIGNDLSPWLINMYRVMRDNHRALEWDPREEYTFQEGDPRTFPDLNPGGAIIDLPPVSAQDIKDWHEITGGVGLDEDTMYGSNLRFFELRRRLNDMMAEGKWKTDLGASEEMARLTAILGPQRINDLMRVNNPTDHFLTVSPRGLRESQKKAARKYPEAHKVAQDLLDEIHTKGKAANIPGVTRLGLNTTLHYQPQRFHDKSGIFRYEPWSREMRANKYRFLQGEANPFLRQIAPKISPENTLIGIDPPYHGEPGEHRHFDTLGLMDALRPFSDRGFPMLAFNSAQMPRSFWRRGGFEGPFEVHPRTESGLNAEAKQVLETVGTANIPGVTQERVQEAQSWPAEEDPVRGYYRHNIWGGGFR